MAKIIGIDLGTTNSVVAIMEGDQPKVLINSQGSRLTPSVVAFTEKGERLVGKATKDAGEIAGLKVLRVLPEPTAAALAYGLDKKKNEKITVFDLGGGTFDVSVLDVGEGVFEVLSINGNTHLGGDDFDEELINYVAEEFRKQEGIDLRKDPMALQRLKEACEKAKIELSNAMETTINLPFITADQTGPKHLQMTMTRSKFEQLITPLVEKCRQPVIDALKDAGLNPEQIDEVVLDGRSKRLSMVQRLVKE